MAFWHHVAGTTQQSFFKEGYGWVKPFEIRAIEEASGNSIETLSVEQIKSYIDFCFGC